MNSLPHNYDAENLYQGNTQEGEYYEDYNQIVPFEDSAMGSPAGTALRVFMPAGHDEMGRLLMPIHERIDHETSAEDLEVFTAAWQPQRLSSRRDWEWTSRIAWPDIPRVVQLKRLDLFEHQNPRLQQGSTDVSASRRIRSTPGWSPVRSIFFLDGAASNTIRLLVESTGPPRRHRFRPHGRSNERDFSKWVHAEALDAFVGADRVPGACDMHVDFCDLPDRYFVSLEPHPPLGMRRMYRFAGYPATQYYILQRQIFSELLEAEGGFGMTYDIQRGPVIFAQKDWRVIGSFYGFDEQLLGSSQFTVYRRRDPFQRMLVALEDVQRPEEWDSSIRFFAFDVPVPGSTLYTLQHCLRSIHSAQASIPRHRLTTEQPHGPWEFRMNVYVMPAALDDCTFTQHYGASDGAVEWLHAADSAAETEQQYSYSGGDVDVNYG